VENLPLDWFFAPIDALPGTITGGRRRLSLNTMKFRGFFAALRAAPASLT
jgi:hypothetical protein